MASIDTIAPCENCTLEASLKATLRERDEARAEVERLQARISEALRVLEGVLR